MRLVCASVRTAASKFPAASSARASPPLRGCAIRRATSARTASRRVRTAVASTGSTVTSHAEKLGAPAGEHGGAERVDVAQRRGLAIGDRARDDLGGGRGERRAVGRGARGLVEPGERVLGDLGLEHERQRVRIGGMQARLALPELARIAEVGRARERQRREGDGERGGHEGCVAAANRGERGREDERDAERRDVEEAIGDQRLLLGECEVRGRHERERVEREAGGRSREPAAREDGERGQRRERTRTGEHVRERVPGLDAVADRERVRYERQRDEPTERLEHDQRVIGEADVRWPAQRQQDRVRDEIRQGDRGLRRRRARESSQHRPVDRRLAVGDPGLDRSEQRQDDRRLLREVRAERAGDLQGEAASRDARARDEDEDQAQDVGAPRDPRDVLGPGRVERPHERRERGRDQAPGPPAKRRERERGGDPREQQVGQVEGERRAAAELPVDGVRRRHERPPVV